MPDSLLEYGGAGALLYLLLKLILDFLSKTKKENPPEEAQAPVSLDVDSLLAIKENSYRILECVKKIYEMHDIKDEDGVYVWYVKASLGRSVHKLGSAAEELVKLLKEDHGS